MNKRWLGFEALGNSFKDLTGHASTTLLCAAVLGLPVLLSATISAAGAPILGGLLTFFSMFFVAGWLPFAITLATKQYAIGQDPGPTGLLDLSANRRLFSYLGTQLLFFLMLLGVVMLVLLPLLGFGMMGFLRGLEGGATFTPRTGMGIFGLIIFVPVMLGLIIFIYLRYGLVAPVNALEGTTPSGAFARSRALLKGRKMDFFLMFLMISVVNAVFSFILSGPGMIVSMTGATPGSRMGGGGFILSPLEMITKRDSLPPLAALLVGVSTYLSSIASTVLMSSAMSNYYLSARGEEVLAEPRSVPGDEGVDPWPAPAPPPDETDPNPDQE
ncbi:MAG TPA: hypothetical protein VNA87_05035 [Actinomycetota bacterium]|nr:hypothetical protein [Actinomycetota bacterium]